MCKKKEKMPQAPGGHPQIAQGAMGHISLRECRFPRNRFCCTFHDENEKFTRNSKKLDKTPEEFLRNFSFYPGAGICLHSLAVDPREPACKMELSGSFICCTN